MQELKEQKIWLLWQWEDRDGKRTKVPKSVKNGKASGTSAKWAHTWGSYDDAVAAGKKYRADGIGFSVPKGYFFLDIDHKETDDPFVQKMLTRFDSYAERSVSGNGIHIYGKCDFDRMPKTDKDGILKPDKAFYQKNPHNGTELYIGGLTNHFAVVTEDVLLDRPLRDCTEAMLTTLDKDMRKAEKKKYSPKRDGDDKGTFKYIAYLRSQKNGEKFCKLFDEGDISDYGSSSEADCALCALIAFRTGPDPAQIDAVYRHSALYRDKWERDDYREATITAGIDACHGTFHRSKMDYPDFIRFNSMTGMPYVVTPLLAKYVREHVRYLLVRDNGKQGVLKYVYDGGVYKLYADDMFKGIIKGFIEDYDPELVKMGQVSEALQHIVTDLHYYSQDDLNVNEHLINFRNGLLSVTKDRLILNPHTPDILTTIQIPGDWKDEPSPTPVFDQYMATLTNGRKDVENLLLEVLGVAISNVKAWRMKKSLFMVGPGDSGKSVLKSLAERFIGRGNFIGIDLKEIEARFGTGAIYGTRLAGSSDMSFLTVDELKTFKKITGGDSLFAEFKGQQAFEFTYNGFLWFCMNRLPKFGGDDGQWVYDRIMVVQCPNSIPKEKQDKQLLDKLYYEREGILYKAVCALQTVIANGYRFSEPQCITAAREAYMSENSTVVGFFEECMCPWPNGKINYHCTTGRIYKVYQAWCRENNNGYAKTAKEFREELARHLGSAYADVTTRAKGNTYYKDYSLTLAAKEQYQREYGYDGTDFPD